MLRREREREGGEKREDGEGERREERERAQSMPMELAKFSGTADDPHWTGTSLNPPTTPIKPALGGFFYYHGVRSTYRLLRSTEYSARENGRPGNWEGGTACRNQTESYLIGAS